VIEMRNVFANVDSMPRKINGRTSKGGEDGD